ncbi:SMC-Scp complex subunit ScpB [Candidatus Parcubacteria bacterium]|nr:SMC-Scp complex subunit ScpB [Candidatus Parcubacteria bacterium]
MQSLESQLEAVLFYASEPFSVKELVLATGAREAEVKAALKRLQDAYAERGIVLVSDGSQYSFGTHPGNAALVEKMQKEEFSKELGRAGLETLAVILYRTPISRREIDQIRGVNSGFILRTLLIRGLIERTESQAGERSFTYKPSLKLFEHLGIRRREELPEFGAAWKAVDEFIKTEGEKDDNRDA